MSRTYTAVVMQDGDWWIGWIKEIPGVNCQEATQEELLETLRITLQEELEAVRAYDAAKVANDEFIPFDQAIIGIEYPHD